MKRIVKEVTVELLDYDELTDMEKALLARACIIRLNAQAPYSNYWVGCSLLTAESRLIYSGCNVERVSWTQTDHAEQNAVSSAIARLGPCRIKALAVVGAPSNEKVIWPPENKKIDSPEESPILSVGDFCPACGHCLQIIAENCFDENGNFDPTVPLLDYHARAGLICRTIIGDALPMPFLPQHLGINYTNDPRTKKTVLSL